MNRAAPARNPAFGGGGGMGGGAPPVDQIKVSGNSKGSYANGHVPEDALESNSGNLVPCKFCGRTFNADRVKKHMDTCAK
jgi:hypothetical protein